MDLISVIVPVYKVEKYLDRCVESIVNQTYKNLEIILVDDGSPDNCGAMCDSWAEKDSRIKVIHKENGGLSDARNAGMDAATGDLMGFVDSDDYISPDMYQLLYENILENNSDVSACGVQIVFEDDRPANLLTKDGNIVLNTGEAMKAIIEESYLKQPVWYKLYKTELIKDIPFVKGKYHEDVFWSYQAIGKAKIVSVFDLPCYFYLQRDGSIMGENYSLKRLDALDAKCQRIEYLKEKFPSLVSDARIDLFYSCLYLGQQALLNSDKELETETFSKIKSITEKYGLLVDDYSKLSFVYKIWALLTKISLPLVCRLRNLLGIGK